MKKIILGVLLSSPVIAIAGTHNAYIKTIQGEGLDDPYNSIHLDKDIQGSPCSSTNDSDRFAISNQVHQSLALAALMADKKVTIMPTGVCNDAQIETINFLNLKASE